MVSLPATPWASLDLREDGLSLSCEALESIIYTLAENLELQKLSMEQQNLSLEQHKMSLGAITQQLEEQKTVVQGIEKTVAEHEVKIQAPPPQPPRPPSQQSPSSSSTAPLLTPASADRSNRRGTMFGKAAVTAAAVSKFAKMGSNSSDAIGGVASQELDDKLNKLEEKITKSIEALASETKTALNRLTRQAQTLHDTTHETRAIIESGFVAAKIEDLQESTERMDNDLETLRLHWQQDHAQKADKKDTELLHTELSLVRSGQRECMSATYAAQKFFDQVSNINTELEATKNRLVELWGFATTESADTRGWVSKRVSELTTEIQSKSGKEEFRIAQNKTREELNDLANHITEISHATRRHFEESVDKKEVQKIDRQMEKVEQMLTVRNGALLGTKCLSCNRSPSEDRLPEARVDPLREKEHKRTIYELQKAYKEEGGGDCKRMEIVAMNVGKLALHGSPERRGIDGQMYEIREASGDVVDDVIFLPKTAIGATSNRSLADRGTPRRKHPATPTGKGKANTNDLTQWVPSKQLSDLLRPT